MARYEGRFLFFVVGNILALALWLPRVNAQTIVPIRQAAFW